MECASERACINGICIDPCTLRGACGSNALCKTVLHRPRCSCPNCFIGRPNIECKPDQKCVETTSPRPNDYLAGSCQTDIDCPENLRCDANRQCNDPCQDPVHICEENKKCVARRHKPVCVCKYGFVVNELGELTCAADKMECHDDEECSSNMACMDGKCINPCIDNNKSPTICPATKQCQVLNHKAICICIKDCTPSLSICLRDNGCPIGLACRNYQCVNPCDSALCAENSPCYVEDHKPICKFCPSGFISDVQFGCLKGKILYLRRLAQIFIDRIAILISYQDKSNLIL